MVGVAGASASYVVGKLADAYDPRRVILAASIVFIAAWPLLAWQGASIGSLIVDVILFDLGMQSAHVANMARNLAVRRTAMSRASTLYMTIRFAGGALGATLGNYAWSQWHWPGVCGVGFFLHARQCCRSLSRHVGGFVKSEKRTRAERYWVQKPA